jgi:alkanesulfonate monooxygenase SsuD/methylene tetrahydromethanopterin reductase-like flavin-dependent oxidoreductase (luciferase family)
VPLLRLGVSLQPRWPLDDGTAVLRAARHAEELGFDHVAVGNRLLDSGFGVDSDPLVLLAAVAGATNRLRLLTSVLVVPYYPALVLANQVATLDVLSRGRLILGVGSPSPGSFWLPVRVTRRDLPSRAVHIVQPGYRSAIAAAFSRSCWCRS